MQVGTRLVQHRNLGECQVTDACLYMQRTNPDRFSMCVEHDGELIEVTKAMVDEVEYTDGHPLEVCGWCGKTLQEHNTVVPVQAAPRDPVQYSRSHKCPVFVARCDGLCLRIL